MKGFRVEDLYGMGRKKVVLKGLGLKKVVSTFPEGEQDPLKFD